MEKIINDAWENRYDLSPKTEGDIKETVKIILKKLNEGTYRVAEKEGEKWIVHQWIKKAIFLYFRLIPAEVIKGGPNDSVWFDKFPSKFQNWDSHDFMLSKIRAIPSSIVRYGSFIGKDTVLLPSFVNVGAYIGEKTMIDTWATVGSCAQIGSHCHISGGVGIGGVLEPPVANPVIIEDHVFIGARSEIAEGVCVREGSVLSMGVFLSQSTKIIDRESGEIFQGYVPPYSVVVPGSLPGKPLKDGSAGPSLSCAVIVKRVDPDIRLKTKLNDLLRF